MLILKKHTLLIFLFLFSLSNDSFGQNNGSNVLFEIIEQDAPMENGVLSKGLSIQNRRDIMQIKPLSVNIDILEQLRN